MNQRIAKVNKLIKREAGKIILVEADFPRDIILTITKVESSKDLRYADIFISVLPTDKEIEIMELLKEEIYFIQQKLNKKLYLKPLPRIRFVIDKSGENVSRIEELIRNSK
ncbi:MAG: 30S ribosome-binding factor RbfA [Patescibacteria group bacterium]|nr:30S ribosome-binding factor RbfA [Patescibacteria group bacterium]